MKGRIIMDKKQLEKALEIVQNMTSVCDKGKSEVSDLLYAMAGEEKPKNLMGECPETHYYVGGDGSTWSNNVDTLYVEIGNWFTTQEQAKKEAEYFKVMTKLRCIARNLNDGWKPDWSISTDKYYIEYYKGWSVKSYMNYNSLGGVYFKTEASAQKALDSLTDTEKQTLLEGGG